MLKKIEKKKPTHNPVHIGQLKISFKNFDLGNIKLLTGSNRELPTIPAVVPEHVNKNNKNSTILISPSSHIYTYFIYNNQ